jgi:SMI1 / KNR4 family (SUKH-1)
MNTYETFFRAYYDDHKDLLLKSYTGSLLMSPENYNDLVLQKTTIQEQDFIPIEKKIKLTIPKAFKQFFATAYSYQKDFQLTTFSLAAAWYEDPFEALNDFLFENALSKNMLDQQLIPIGIYQDNFYVCLDLRQHGSETDAPISYFDLDAAMLNDEPIAEAHVFASFEKFIEHLTNCILTKTY